MKIKIFLILQIIFATFFINICYAHSEGSGTMTLKNNTSYTINILKDSDQSDVHSHSINPDMIENGQTSTISATVKADDAADSPGFYTTLLATKGKDSVIAGYVAIEFSCILTDNDSCGYANVTKWTPYYKCSTNTFTNNGFKCSCVSSACTLTKS